MSINIGDLCVGNVWQGENFFHLTAIALEFVSKWKFLYMNSWKKNVAVRKNDSNCIYLFV